MTAGEGFEAAVAAPARPDDRSELGVLTSVRAFAALEVVLLHTLFELGGPWALSLPSPLLRILGQGQVAVSFFFVLSGFILAYTYRAADGRLRGTSVRFWRARFARIYPLYALAFLLDLPRGLAFFLGGVGSPLAAWGRVIISAIAYLTLAQSWYPRVTNSWNTPGWSLSVEAFFYALFPRILTATRRGNGRRLIVVALTAWVVPLVGYALVGRSHTGLFARADVQTLWRSFPLLRLPEFMLGVGVGALFVSGELNRHRRALRWAGFAAMALILLLLGSPARVPKELLENTLEAPLFAVAIAAAAAGALRTPAWLISKPLLMLGRASYAVYIVHQPFKSLFLWVAGRLGLVSPSPILLLAYLVLLNLFCVALFRYFEDPCRRLITRPGEGRRGTHSARIRATTRSG
jgi:peptidoglycan/LPS O-acetylase OafA/YrhL